MAIVGMSGPSLGGGFPLSLQGCQVIRKGRAFVL